MRKGRSGNNKRLRAAGPDENNDDDDELQERGMSLETHVPWIAAADLAGDLARHWSRAAKSILRETRASPFSVNASTRVGARRRDKKEKTEGRKRMTIGFA